MTRQPIGPADRFDTMSVNASIADPRLEGRTVKRIVYDAADIASRVQQLGEEITAAYPDGELLVLGLLKGSFIFVSDLVREVERPLQVDFIVASSYGRGTASSGEVKLLYDPETRIEGKHLLVVEDIVDSGNTLRRLLVHLAARLRGRSLSVPFWTRSRCMRLLQNSNSSDSTPRRPSWWATVSITPKTFVTSLSSRT